MIFIDNKYTHWYYNIIDNAKRRTIDSYTESHHIIPECFFKQRIRKGPAGWVDGNPEDKSNKVKLTAKEHFICHHLLTKMLTENRPKAQMVKALERMTVGNKNHNRYTINARLFEQIRINAAQAHSILVKGKPGHSKGKKCPNISIAKKGKSITLPPRTKEHQDNLNKSLKGKPAWNKGKTYTNKKYKRLTCPHCGIEGIVANIKRWHMDNCKSIPMATVILAK
jgi:hypothetical protein